MALRADPTAPADLDEIARLLCVAFGAPPEARFAERHLLRWKYLEPAGEGSPARSYVLRQGSDIVAHCAMAPLRFRGRSGRSTQSPGAGSVSGACFMDWVGDRRVPGAGVTLLKKVMALADVGVIAGGSDATRALAPKIGFRQRHTVDLFARVIRPFQQARSRPRTSAWRDTARLLRNTGWSLASGGRLEAEWRALPVSGFSELRDEASHPSLLPERTAADLNYWLRCPAAAVSGFEIHRRDTRVGYFLLCQIEGQARIADLRLQPSAALDREMAYRLAVRTAALHRSVSEVVCLGSTPEMVSALEACGFRRRSAEPLFVYDRQGRLPENSPIVWSMIDDDTAYIYDSQNPYAT